MLSVLHTTTQPYICTHATYLHTYGGHSGLRCEVSSSAVARLLCLALAAAEGSLHGFFGLHVSAEHGVAY
jgi:hypothetical protein